MHGIDLERLRGLLLTRELGREVRWVPSAPSTNDLGLAALAEPGSHGRVFLAEEQTAGRGRAGRAWLAPRGKALLLSVVLKPRLEPVTGLGLSLTGAVSVCEALHEEGLGTGRIKWPNDVLGGRGKLAGILAESRWRGQELEGVVLGIGLNVNQGPEELPEGASSVLGELGRPADRTRLLAAVLNALEPWYSRCEGGRFGEVREAWCDLSDTHLGHPVTVEEEGRVIRGTSAGIGEDGALRVIRDDGVTVHVRNGSARFG